MYVIRCLYYHACSCIYIYIYVYICILKTDSSLCLAMFSRVPSAARASRSAVLCLFDCYPRSPLQDSRLFGPSPWKILAATYEQMDS